MSASESISKTALCCALCHFRAELTTCIDTPLRGPNDAKANELLDIFHHTMTMALDGKLYTAPLKEDIKTALDVGTGSGKLIYLDCGPPFTQLY